MFQAVSLIRINYVGMVSIKGAWSNFSITQAIKFMLAPPSLEDPASVPVASAWSSVVV